MQSWFIPAHAAVVIDALIAVTLGASVDNLTGAESIVVTAVVTGIECIVVVVYVAEVLTGVLSDKTLDGTPTVRAEVNTNSLAAVIAALEFAVLPALGASFLPC